MQSSCVSSGVGHLLFDHEIVAYISTLLQLKKYIYTYSYIEKFMATPSVNLDNGTVHKQVATCYYVVVFCTLVCMPLHYVPLLEGTCRYT